MSRDGTLFYALDNPAFYVRVLQASDLEQVQTILTPGTVIAMAPDGAVFVVYRSIVQSYIGDSTNGYVLGPKYQASEVPKRMFFDSSGATLLVVNSNGVVDVIR